MASSSTTGTPVIGLCAYDSRGVVHRHDFFRPAVKGKDVRVDIDYCGMCHSDLHTIRGEWGYIKGHMAPGHEIAGKVVEVGPDCTKFKVGDVVGVGCMVGSCGNCEMCERGWEQHCDSGMVGTYNASGFRKEDGCDMKTQGGYTTEIVVDEHFVCSVPEGADLERVGPLLCAGITTYSPLKYHGCGPGKKVAVAGLGGLGHMAVKIAKAMGAEVTVLSRSHAKDEHAKALGANVIAHTDKSEIKANRRSFDLIIDTIAFEHDLNPFVSMMKVGSTICLLGGVSTPVNVTPFTLLVNKIVLTGSLIGGMAETQEMLDFCVKNNIYPDSETITADKANYALDQLLTGNKAGRYTIDVKASNFASLPLPSEEDLAQTKTKN